MRWLVSQTSLLGYENAQQLHQSQLQYFMSVHLSIGLCANVICKLATLYFFRHGTNLKAKALLVLIGVCRK